MDTQARQGVFLAAVLALALVALLPATLLSPGCGGGLEQDDCAEFNPPVKDKQFGQDCASFTYGLCPTVFSDCVSGNLCAYTQSHGAGGDICTRNCTTDASCPSGFYCRASTSAGMVCSPRAVCQTYCDGTLCCTYAPDSRDPTQCKQISCR